MGREWDRATPRPTSSCATGLSVVPAGADTRATHLPLRPAWHPPGVDPLIVAVAQYAIYLVAAGAVLGWLLMPRHDKLGLAGQAVVTVVVVAVLVKVAGAVHTDPRPFVADPRLHPMFVHPADNGFPSDHTALTSAVALSVMLYRRWLGLALLVLSIAIGVSRVAAHVHHTQDIVAAVFIGALAAATGFISWRHFESRWRTEARQKRRPARLGGKPPLTGGPITSADPAAEPPVQPTALPNIPESKG